MDNDNKAKNQLALVGFMKEVVEGDCGIGEMKEVDYEGRKFRAICVEEAVVKTLNIKDQEDPELRRQVRKVLKKQISTPKLKL